MNVRIYSREADENIDKITQLYYDIAYTNPSIAGIVIHDPAIQNVPGNVFMVAAYIALYIGP